MVAFARLVIQPRSRSDGRFNCLLAAWWTFYRECRPRRVGLEKQSIDSVFLDGFSRIVQREIAASIPERHQIGIMATTRLPALTRRIDGNRLIPVTVCARLSCRAQRNRNH